MRGQHLGELVLVFGLEQRIDRAGRQRGKGLVGRREDGERTGALQGIDKAGGLDGGDQRRVVLRVDGVLDDVFGGIHRRAADIRVLGVSGRGNRHAGDKCGKGDGPE